MKIFSKLFLFFVAVFLYVIFATYVLHLHINTSPSVPTGIYQVISAPVEKGRYVEVCPPPREPFLTAHARGYIKSGTCPDEFRYLLKKVVALEGDSISMRNDGLFVNGRKIKDSTPLNEDLYHRPFSKWRIENYILKENEVLLMGENPASWDGRYFGILPTSEILSVLKAVWVSKK